jgi:hypothetical protein
VHLFVHYTYIYNYAFTFLGSRIRELTLDRTYTVLGVITRIVCRMLVRKFL